MTRLQLTIRSSVLDMQVTATVLAPNNITENTKVLWLLHGYSDSDVTWCENTRLIPLAAGRDMVVVMPHGYNSYYSDTRSGIRTLTALETEVFPIIQNLLHLTRKRACNIIAGQSMGGYGAVKIALRHPDQYARVCSLSGALDVVSAYSNHRARALDFMRLFGTVTDFKGSSDDLFYLVKRSGVSELSIRLICGEEDVLLQDSKHFYAVARKSCKSVSLSTVPNAGHDWKFWDMQLPSLLDWAEEF